MQPEVVKGEERESNITKHEFANLKKVTKEAEEHPMVSVAAFDLRTFVPLVRYPLLLLLSG